MTPRTSIRADPRRRRVVHPSALFGLTAQIAAGEWRVAPAELDEAEGHVLLIDGRYRSACRAPRFESFRRGRSCESRSGSNAPAEPRLQCYAERSRCRSIPSGCSAMRSISRLRGPRRRAGLAAHHAVDAVALLLEARRASGLRARGRAAGVMRIGSTKRPLTRIS